ncbi:heterocyst differentiation protein HetZ [Prochlorothrix hollandica]|uniref:ATPase involved in DNA repair n=1 Tax=Prochlorothrix hollandica PCC 9006 = CALU 1027 TaxID=317619 RepID=A0A0M2PPL9_PROHO|nr:heterocyst differentiation protein HetZ [Prochlorothrix hollandica]KKI98209.1 ATPase involved in DNA repair [Prochlorothrix hollandica PCC 9006 = CALU 1027]
MPIVEITFNLIYQELRRLTKASESHCRAVADRLAVEVDRICTESQRIQASGEIETWAISLARHRLNQCFKYYRLGSRQGRIELHSTLSAVVYRYISRANVPASYQARLTLIEDFLQGFYIETLNALRREAVLPATYQPRTLLELAEYMAFSERYAKRRIVLPRRRSQQLIILRAQTFSQQQPQETLVDIEQAAEGVMIEDNVRTGMPLHQVREKMVTQDRSNTGETLRRKVIQELLDYLTERQQQDCADYFSLRLQDLPTQEIERILGLSSRQRDYLQQRFKYHLIRFALSHRWQLVHEWLEADLDNNLGLLPQEWAVFRERLTVQQIALLQLKQHSSTDGEIAQALGCTVSQVQRQWSKLLQQAWEVRNGAVTPLKISSAPRKP